MTHARPTASSRGGWLLCLVWLVALFASQAALAQEVSLRLPPEPLYAGLPLEITVIAAGFADEPRPEVTVAPPAGATLEQIGYSPNVSSQIVVINGRVKQTRLVQLVFRYQFSAREPGSYTLGPFRVEQAGVVASSSSVELKLDSVPPSNLLRLRLVLPERPVYAGERVPISLEWSIAGTLRPRIHDYSITSPLFERSDRFQFIDEPIEPGDPRVQIDPTTGRLDLKAHAETRTIRGNEFIVYVASRTLVPLLPGDYTLAPARVVVEEVTSFRRGLLGTRSPAAVRRLRADDLARQLVVRPIPVEDRPPSFAGAVGRGFSMRASADRSVVQVGDPITLTLALTGDGNLAAAGLPDLAASGLSSQQFRLPSSDLAGRVEQDAKSFQLQIRVLDPGVHEIPELAYSWFDPERGRFETAHSRPIALSVRAAELVTAADVIGSERVPAAADAPNEPARGAAGQAAAQEPAATPIPPALALVSDPARLLRPTPRGALSTGALRLLYVGPLLLLALAVVARRRLDADPELAARRQVLRSGHRAVAEAGDKPRAQAVAAIAESLRKMARAAPGARSPQLDSFIAECESVVYAPDAGGPGELDRAFHARALELAERLLEHTP